MPLIYLSCAWVLGIFLGTKFYLPITFILFGFVPFFLIAIVRKHQKSLILAGLSLITFFGAATYSHSGLDINDESSLRYYNDGAVIEIRGIVSRDPDTRDKSTHLQLQATEIKLDKDWQAVKGTALLIVPRYTTYRYGDVLQVSGKLESPAQFNDFDYKGYLATQGIYTTMLYPKIEIEQREKGLKLMQWIYSARNSMSQTLSMVLPEPQAALAQGIILGIRDNIPLSVKTDFVRTGTAHLLAISGLHLGIIAGIILSAGMWLFGRRYYLYVWLALGTIWLYTLFTGMHPPVARGAIMVSLFLAAEIFGRQRSAFTALTFAAAIMLGISPYILGNAAFQLSFLAMAGLVFIFPSFRRLGRKAVDISLGDDGLLASAAKITTDSLSASLAAIIAVWPVVVYYFGIIAFVGPLATLLTLPALPGIILTGAITGGLGLIALPIAQVFGWLTWLFLTYTLLIVNGLTVLPLSSIELNSFNNTLIWIYYPVLAIVIFLNQKKSVIVIPEISSKLKSHLGKSFEITLQRSKKWIILPLLLIAILVSVAAVTMPDDKIHVTFLDVSQGDAILIQKGNQQVLIDGGPSPQATRLELGNRMPFWDRTIDLIVLTHPHHDHLVGLVEVLRYFQVKQVLYPDTLWESPTYEEFLILIKEKNVESTIARTGQQINLGDSIVLNVLNPSLTRIADTESDVDNNSIVLRLITGKVSFLLTADISQETEFNLIANRANLDSTVLKVAHHGSDTSTTLDFLAVVEPQIAVISYGANNKFGHPSEAVLERLEDKLGSENIYRTDQHGNIEFITNGEKLWVKMRNRLD